MFVIASIIIIKRAYFYKDRISRKFKRNFFEKDPTYLIDYYQVLYELKNSLNNNNIQYNINSIRVLGKLRDYRKIKLTFI